MFTAPEPVRVRFKDRYKTGLVSEAARMRSNKGSDPVTYTTNVVIRSLARSIKRLNDPDGAIAALAGADIEAHTPVPVIQKKIQDHPGELGKLTKSMSDGGINVYMFYLSADGEIVLGVDDIEKARAVDRT